MREEDKLREYDDFLSIIYSELETILERRPKNPVTTFAHRYAIF